MFDRFQLVSTTKIDREFLRAATKKRNTRSKASSHNNAERRADMVDQTSSNTLSDHVVLSRLHISQCRAPVHCVRWSQGDGGCGERCVERCSECEAAGRVRRVSPSSR